MDIRDLADRAIAVAAHHINDPRPVEAAGTVPDDGTPGYAITELRRITYWSLDKHSAGPALLGGLAATPDDLTPRQQAAQILAGDLHQYPHLVPAVHAFVARAWAMAAVAARPVDPWSSDATPTGAMPTNPWPVGAPSWPMLSPGPARPVSGLQIGQRHLGWGLVAALLAGLLVLAGGGTATAILLTRPASSVADAPVRFQGMLEFGGFDLDQSPPRTGGLGMDVISTSGPSFTVAGGAVGVKYSDNSTPTRAQCHQAIAQFGVSGVGPAGQTSVLDQVSPGMVFCVSTRGGLVAALKIKATTDSTFTAEVTVWLS